MTETVIRTIREVMQVNVRDPRRAVVKCFYCDKPGHFI